MNMITGAMIAILALAAPAASASADGKAAFERLKSLAGDWQGTVGTPAGHPAAIRYEVGSGGTIVRELLFPGTEHEMLNVYHLVDGQLVATHYCAMGNQPRFKLQSATTDELVFGFAGGTNFVPEKDAHIHDGRIKFVAPDRLEEDWTAFAAGKPAGDHKFVLTRKR
jgi:hypothetical protein